MSRAGWIVPALMLQAAAPATDVPGPAGPVRRAAVERSIVATLEAGDRLFLEVQAGPRDSYVSMAQRFCGSESQWSALERANAGRQVAPGKFYAVPAACLTPAHRARAVAALFPADGPEDEGWVHRVPEGDPPHSLAAIAVWFTGDENLADDLAESNGVDMAPLQAGAEITIPSAILSEAFASLAPATAPPPAVAQTPPPPKKPPGPPVKAGDLTYLEDERGAYALYRIKPGEALYSSVVIRFTGRLDPEEVNAVAARIAELSGIERIRSIPAGFTIRIPRDLILPEYLPPGDPARAEYDAAMAAAGRHTITARARDLEGITLILDAGHGGDDVGARRNGVQEDDYVYDVMCRIKALAESSTAARVLVTIGDGSSAWRPLDGTLRIDRDEYLLTSPRYTPRQPHVATAGVNLRWYLVNSYYRGLIGKGVAPDQVVFLSLHADSLHPSVRGAMVYVPGQSYRTRTYGHVGSLYDRKEVNELRYVRFSRNERERSEGLSLRLAAGLMKSFRAAGLGVHPYEPVRNHVIRRRRAWVPAVIRTSLVPQSLLLEVVNLNNRMDAALMLDSGFRQKVAQAVLDALRAHYGSDGPPDSKRQTRTR